MDQARTLKLDEKQFDTDEPASVLLVECIRAERVAMANCNPKPNGKRKAVRAVGARS